MREVTPKAELVGHDIDSKVDNLQKIYAGFRRCYSAEEGPEISPIGVFDMREAEAFIRKMRKTPHESPLEHATLTFHLTMSRAASHQLVRHRLASYSQQSQRYVRMDDLPVIIPASYGDENSAARARLFEALRLIEWTYKKGIQDGVPAEDARAILPNCTATRVVMTMNFRSLLHFFEERLCNRAQWEIRDLAGQMFKLCVRHYPAIFETAGPKCKRLKFCPEAKPCGAAPWKK